jgi:thiol:disulfide interchange protein DsbA
MRIVAMFLGLIFSLNLMAADSSAAGAYLEGKDYSLIEEPQKTIDPSKIEVAEVYSYTCPHCFHFEPLIEAWIHSQKSDVVLVQTHVGWGEPMLPYQRGFYTAVVLKIKDKIQMDVFNAIHKDQKQLKTPEDWAEFLSHYGVSKQTVASTYDSFVVSGMITQADARVRAFKVTGTPELIVEGKYRINSRLAGGHEEMLKVAQFLVDKIRAERAKAH